MVPYRFKIEHNIKIMCRNKQISFKEMLIFNYEYQTSWILYQIDYFSITVVSLSNWDCIWNRKYGSDKGGKIHHDRPLFLIILSAMYLYFLERLKIGDSGK